MAEIFLARRASVAGVERYCVLKRILRDHASDAQFVRMFVNEARLASQLQHPNIASVYDVGMLGDSYFFTMEYVHGETVRSLIDRARDLRRPVPLAAVLTIIAGAASGLHHAHERKTNDGRPLGIVHRDVSPSNLMVSFEGNVKIVDFGVAKANDRGVETQAGMVKGKIGYLSPEQCRAERVDRRSDLFSLGIVMWEMLIGKRLYRRVSDFQNMSAIVNEPPPPPSSCRPEVPRAIDEIVLRLLAKSMTDRFQTAAEVLEAIEGASMRAGTLLSTSALSRLVHDLFGHRPEPWLTFEGETLTDEPISLASRQLPERFEDDCHEPTVVAATSELRLSKQFDLGDEPARPAPPPRLRTSRPGRAPDTARTALHRPIAGSPSSPPHPPAASLQAAMLRGARGARAPAFRMLPGLPPPAPSTPAATLRGISAPPSSTASMALGPGLAATPRAPAWPPRNTAWPAPLPAAPASCLGSAPKPSPANHRLATYAQATPAPFPAPRILPHASIVGPSSMVTADALSREKRAARFTPPLIAIVLLALIIGAIETWLLTRNSEAWFLMRDGEAGPRRASDQDGAPIASDLTYQAIAGARAATPRGSGPAHGARAHLTRA